MPTVTAFIDDLRSAFGTADINPAIKAGLDGLPRFWASENGLTVGTKAPEGVGVSGRDLILWNVGEPEKGKK